MVWKPKEKELTPSEVVALVKSQIDKDWFLTASPLVVAVEYEGAYSLHPLEKTFLEKSWCVAFVDPNCNEGRRLLEQLSSWGARYESHGVHFLAALFDPFNMLVDRSTVENLLERSGVSCPSFLDRGGMAARSLGLSSCPGLAFLSGGETLWRQQGTDWLEGVEQKIHDFLRTRDPGLSLPMLESGRASNPVARDLVRCDFAPRDSSMISTQVSRPATSVEFKLEGQWQHESHYLVTQDPLASLSFTCESQAFSVVAGTLSRVLERAKVVVEVDDRPVFEVFGWEDLSFDEVGRSTIEVRDPRLYRVVQGLTTGQRVVIRFPSASSLPVALYTLIFS